MTNLRNHTQIKHSALLMNLTNFSIYGLPLEGSCAFAGFVRVFVNQIYILGQRENCSTNYLKQKN